MANKNIFIKNQDGEFCKWEVQDENEKAYKVRYYDLFTDVYKNKINFENGKLVSSEVRKTKFDNGNFAIASLGIVRLEN